MNLSYVLPLRWSDDAALPDLSSYLRAIAGLVDLIVVDGSDPQRFQAHADAWARIPMRHFRPDHRHRCLNGKVAGVRTGVAQAHFEHVVIADDDVRYEIEGLIRIRALLDDVDAVRPQNYFEPRPWHAQWDTARTLINRCVGRDWPGTFGIRRPTFARMSGYSGDVLFENLELVRALRAAGGAIASPLDLYVRRRPPSFRHFLSQRVRQAYDEFARPALLALWLMLAPAVIACAVVGGVRTALVLVAAIATVAIAAAEVGRRRAHGTQVFSPSATLYAPLWIAERTITAWIAVIERLGRGGIPYGGRVILRAATPRSRLSSSTASQRWALTPDKAGTPENPTT